VEEVAAPCIPDEDEDEVPVPRIPEDKEEEVLRRPPEEDDVGGVLAVKRPHARRPGRVRNPSPISPSRSRISPSRSRGVATLDRCLA
jgi:hypothetical protein